MRAATAQTSFFYRHATLGGLLVIVILGTFISIGDFDVRLANRYAEDSAVLYSHYFANPTHWAGDSWMKVGRLYVLGSICNWVPALLFKYARVRPEIPTLLFTYLQNILLILALYVYGRQFSRRAVVIVLFTLFVLAVVPYQWNPVIMSASFESIYPGQMVIPIHLLGASALLMGKEGWAFGLLLLAGLVHPGLSLSMSAFIGVYFLMSMGRVPHAVSVKRFGLLFLTTATYVIPPILLSGEVTDPVSRPELMAILRNSGHLFPWLFDWSWSRDRDYVFPTLIGYVILLAWRPKTRQNPGTRQNDLLRSTAGVLIILFGAYALGVIAGIPKLIQPLFPRFVGTLCLFALPPLLARLVATLESEVSSVIASIITLLALWFFHGWGFFIGPVLVLFLSRNRSFTDRKGWGILIAWTVLLFATPLLTLLFHSPTPARIARFCLAPGVLVERYAFLFSLALGAVIAGFAKAAANREKLLWGACVIFLGITFHHFYRLGETTRTPFAKSVYEAQMWSRSHTNPNAIFVIAPEDMSWRVLSNRRAINSEVGPGIAYSGSRSLLEDSERHQKFLRDNQVTRLADITSTETFWKFKKVFGGDYLIVNKNTALAFPKVYENEELTIYQLQLPGVP
jgi:hypothetical protein